MPPTIPHLPLPGLSRLLRRHGIAGHSAEYFLQPLRPNLRGLNRLADDQPDSRSKRVAAGEGDFQKTAVHHKALRSLGCARENEPVHVGDVVAHPHGRTLRGDVVGPLFLETIQATRQRPADEAIQKLRPQRVNVDGYRQIQQGDHQKDLRNRDPRL